ncbi:NACHT domain-containing protein [Streptomyces sp. NPDC126503]|uniref:NACHT domain-containing protein n=1 Tax=Streptomyces sp. NPDC126503 TaxID=3155315 RepID=UPI00332B3D67
MTVVRSVVLVQGKHQGSGVLVAPDLVLTSAHVLGGVYQATVIPALRPPSRSQVIWSDEQLDAALLRSPARLGPAPRLSAIATDRPVPGCEILGFPHIQRYDGQKPDLDQFTGTALPMAGLLRRVLTIELDGPPSTAAEDGPSPLAGLSGAPVFANNSLIGIVRAVPRGRGHRRLECVPLQAVLARADAQALMAPHTSLTPVTGTHSHDQPYEEDYGEAIGSIYRRTRIFGLDELGKRASEWDLDTAYLSLEATTREPDAVAVPQRIDDLLASRPRVLLRGDAGAGKTTLVWWLAAHAAAGTLGRNLAELNGLVPFVVPLRTLRAQGAGYPSPAELPSVAGLMVDPAPDGWAGRVLAAGRGLLLVDGLDEVPGDEREAAHAWLSRLLARYPRTRCVATVRPFAVAPDWLGSERFEELTLLPLRDSDIQAFVHAWHEAARLDADGDAHENLTELEHDLAQQFRHNPTLADLARTPLLCAVICALHRLREGFLPETRWELYRSALQMLLGVRDERRRIDAPDGIRMSVEEHSQLLQRLAAWLVRGGQTEFTREQALRQLARALPGMPRVTGQGSPEEILTHLLNRSGLLQERTDDVFHFAHRTFQDFLAAKELVEDDQLAEALRHAHDQQWHDVLLLAAGHCTRRDLPILVEGLLAAGSATRKRDLKTTLYVLAALAAQHAAWLDGSLHTRVRKAVKSVIPPRSPDQMTSLLRLGGYVLPLLPGPADVANDAVEAVTTLIALIGGREALPYARAFAEAGEADRFASYWLSFPPEAFAREVLSHLARLEPVLISSVQQLRLLADLPDIDAVILVGPLPCEEITRYLGDRPLRHLAIAFNHLMTADVLRSLDCSQLRHVQISDCLQLTDLTPFIGLPAVRVSVAGMTRKDIIGADALGDRLTVG